MFTGDLKTLTKTQGAKLSEDWKRGKPTKNINGEEVFRFQIATTVLDKEGKPQSGVAVVDIQETIPTGVENGNGTAK